MRHSSTPMRWSAWSSFRAASRENWSPWRGWLVCSVFVRGLQLGEQTLGKTGGNGHVVDRATDCDIPLGDALLKLARLGAVLQSACDISQLRRAEILAPGPASFQGFANFFVHGTPEPG